MAAKEKTPSTQAVRVLRAAGVSFSDHFYKYEDRGGTRVSAEQLAIDEHTSIKTLIMEDERQQAFIVLMHGDREVSVKELARHLGVKAVRPCSPETAQRHSGYLVGGTSPFGTRQTMPIYMERSILNLPRIYINGGRRGFLVGMDPKEILRVLSPVLVDAAIQEHS
jgi:Cys-tRNA(Pro) deacylase